MFKSTNGIKTVAIYFRMNSTLLKCNSFVFMQKVCAKLSYKNTHKIMLSHKIMYQFKSSGTGWLVSKGSFGKLSACMVAQWEVVLQYILHVWHKACRSRREHVLVPCESHHCNMSDDDSVEIIVISVHGDKYMPRCINYNDTQRAYDRV